MKTTNTGPALALTLSTTLTATALAGGGNLLQNAGFEAAGPDGSFVVSETAVPGGAGNSAAQFWGVFHNTAGTTITELVPTTLGQPGAGDLMMRVVTDGVNNGVSQVFAPFNEGPKCAVSGLWVYVVSGDVFIGTGNHGLTGNDVQSSTNGAWEYLEAPNGACPANSFITYSISPGGAEWYVELASTEADACTADLDHSGSVDVNDLVELIVDWGPHEFCSFSDLNHDGVVDVTDLIELITSWG